MILVDTSAILALADRNDTQNEVAIAATRRANRERSRLLIHSYLIEESTALLQNRLGLDSALRFASSLKHFFVHWIDADDHERAVSLLRARGRRGLSLVDCASFVVMRKYGVTEALAFDEDFS